jgi:hypothetical protein
MRRIACAFLVLFLITQPAAFGGVGSKNTMYVGGTVNSIKAAQKASRQLPMKTRSFSVQNKT